MKLTKTLTSLAVAGLVATVITGCGVGEAKPAAQQEPDFRCKKENVLAPKWTCTPFVDGAIAEVGVAPKTAAGPGMQRRMALANARSNLAQQIETQVKDKVESFTRTTGMGGNETVDAVATAVSKQVAKVTLKGSKQVDAWEAPSGTLYVLVAVPEKSVNEAAKEAVKTSFKNDQALWQQFQSKQALESLEKEFPTD
jgi:hypothetical protein